MHSLTVETGVAIRFDPETRCITVSVSLPRGDIELEVIHLGTFAEELGITPDDVANALLEIRRAKATATRIYFKTCAEHTAPSFATRLGVRLEAEGGP